MDQPQRGILTWRNDPVNFDNYPQFFMAHELAHQWWGQAVGWKNYHEQWISEGFAQYFAALYAGEMNGQAALTNVVRQMRRWALEQTDAGPIYLGYRLGHLENDSRVFRALVYNKGAAVLHMLRRLVGVQGGGAAALHGEVAGRGPDRGDVRPRPRGPVRGGRGRCTEDHLRAGTAPHRAGGEPAH